ncbi:MAG: hypothetical protein AAGF20_04105 [Pseudomonadota bacterium]
MNSLAFLIGSGLLGLVAIVSFILAVRASYKIDQLRRGPVSSPRFTNVFGHAFGAGLPDDADALAAQASLRIHLLRAILSVLAVGALVVLR